MDDVWVRVVLPAASAFVIGGAIVVVLRSGSGVRRDGAPRIWVEPGLDTPLAPAPSAPARPWWGSPWVWLAVCAVCAVLGVFVLPGFFGGTFLFLPLVWIWRPRDAWPDPRSNGHGTRP